jgi:PAS domain S-box-containing protein
MMPERDELGLLLEALPDGVTVQGGDGCFIYANEEAARIAGFASAAEMMRASMEDLLSRNSFWDEGGQLMRVDDMPGRQAMSGKRAQAVLRYRRSAAVAGQPEHGERWVTVTSVPTVDAAGRVHRVVTVIHDVTEQRRAEEWQRFLGDASKALGSSMELETVLASVAEIAVSAIADGCAIVMRVGPGGRGTSVVARVSDLDQTVDADALRAAAAACARELMAADDVGPLLVPETDRDLGMVPASARAAVTALTARGVRSLLAVPLAPRGERLGIILLAIVGISGSYDRSDAAAAEELARRAAIAFDNVRLYAEAQEALRAREDLLAIVSHDLRNPLGVVLASSALLLKSSLPPEREERARRQVEAIQRAGNRMNRLIRDLLDFASVQAGHLSVSVRPQGVADMVNEVMETLEPLAAAKSQRMKAEVPPGLEMRCDHDRVIQLFSNVVGNAIKFTPEGGEIRINAAVDEADGRLVRFAVTDTGPGIPADELPHVFDRYYQARRKNREGIGLGLTIARGIVEAHGGRIWVESEEGNGSTFLFTLRRGEA